ncbi:MAG: ferritin-like domain-containing protein [Cyclobacteriaceae bacterium]
MMKNASSEELNEALSKHLDETKEHVSRLEKVFKLIDVKVASKKCDAMDGLIDEASDIMESCEQGPMRDAGIISAAQKVEHYEIATYGTLRQFAETLELTEVVDLLGKTLKEENAADQKLTKIAKKTINTKAALENV